MLCEQHVNYSVCTALIFLSIYVLIRVSMVTKFGLNVRFVDEVF